AAVRAGGRRGVHRRGARRVPGRLHPRRRDRDRVRPRRRHAQRRLPVLPGLRALPPHPPLHRWSSRAGAQRLTVSRPRTPDKATAEQIRRPRKVIRMSRENSLVSAQWVEEHLDDPKVVLVEVDEDTSAYDKGHIRGAIKLDWTSELQD